MDLAENAIIIQKWFRKNRKNYEWWPLDSNTGSTWSYNKWLHEPSHEILNKKDRKCYNCLTS
jgi:hypothetical protein